MVDLPLIDDYRALFLGRVPFLDLRSPGEFQRGSFPAASSRPLMTDDERAQVGTCYKRQGQAAAIELGHRLVSGAVREARMTDWLDWARDHPGGVLYCWRGGLRSQTVQAWLAEAGVVVPRVRGGYKGLRRFLIDELEHGLAQARLVLVAGATGCGKTRVVEALDQSIDLEGLAHHRGSSFGHLPEPQPSQIDFENALSIALLRRLAAAGEAASSRPLFLEDEGRLIGRIALPENLRQRMHEAPLVLVEEPVEARTQVVLEDYILDLGERYRARLGAEAGDALHRQRLLDGLDRIRKRLGGARHQRLRALMEAAFAAQVAGRGIDAHRAWIDALLRDYYDPMYRYQLDQRQGEILFRGSRQAVIDFARELAAC
jgi:tRNA 2-selenouridine synthase